MQVRLMYCYENAIKRGLYGVFACVLTLVVPSICQANAIVPLSNVFMSGTFVPATILLLLVIVIETFLIRRWIKEVKFTTTVFRVTLFNVASSAVGSIILWAYNQSQQIDFPGAMDLFIPMFFVSVIAEWPLLKWFYRSTGLTWKRTSSYALYFNFISYIFVFVAQFALAIAYLSYSGSLDNKTAQKWTEQSLLEGESGYIFYTDNVKSENRSREILKRFNVGDGTTESYDPGGFGIERSWDAKGNVFVCDIRTDNWEDKQKSVFSIPDVKLITTIDTDARYIRISPDLKKVAALEWQHEVEAPRDEVSHFMIGSACRLKIFSTETGELLQEAQMKVLKDGLVWTSDSQGLIYTTLRDTSLYDFRSTTGTGMGLAYAEKGRFPKDLHLYDLNTSSTNRITEGRDPRLVTATNELSFIRENEDRGYDIVRRNMKTGKEQVGYRDLSGRYHAWSPSGNKLLALIPQRNPMMHSNFLTVIDPKVTDDDHKYIVDSSHRGDFRWVSQ